MILLLKCPNCGNKMKYSPTKQYFSSLRKRCVYCGKSFKVGDQIIKKEP